MKLMRLKDIEQMIYCKTGIFSCRGNLTGFLVYKGYLERIHFKRTVQYKREIAGVLKEFEVVREEKTAHKQPTQLFMDEFVSRELALVRPPMDNGKITWNFTDKFVDAFIKEHIDEYRGYITYKQH